MTGCCLNQTKYEERFRHVAWMGWVISQGPSLPVFYNSVNTELVSFENLFWNEEQKPQKLGRFSEICLICITLQI